jgi:Ran GTPase-activating protein (RanGAP) involved in mRNA processing and transport
LPAVISVLLRALSRNTSVTKAIINIDVVRFASVAFQGLLTSTQTLPTMSVIRYLPPPVEELNEVDIAAITWGVVNNTTLRDLEFQGWREADLAPVLTALRHHPVLRKITLTMPLHIGPLPGLSGLEVVLRSQDSKIKELVLEDVDNRTAGLHKVMRELGRNTTVTNLVIRKSVLSRDNVQQLKSMLRRNTALQFLDLESSALRGAGLVEIAPALYRNTSIKALDLTNNVLDDTESVNVLRELIRRNKTITRLCLAKNTFGRNADAVRSIADGVRHNTTLHQLDISSCSLDDQGISVLANALAIRNASILELNFDFNDITSVGVRALVDDNMEAVKTLTKLCLTHNPIRSEGAAILADACRRNAMPSLKRLDLGSCGMHDDGFVALVLALEQNTSLQIIDLKNNRFGERGFMALAESLPNIKGLQQLHFTAYTSFQSTTLSLLLEGFRKNTSLVEVTINGRGAPGKDCLQEIKFWGHRNRFTPLLKSSGSPTTSPRLGIWSRALAKVAIEPNVLFHVLRNKPNLVGSAGGSKKRKHDECRE